MNFRTGFMWKTGTATPRCGTKHASHGNDDTFALVVGIGLQRAGGPGGRSRADRRHQCAGLARLLGLALGADARRGRRLVRQLAGAGGILGGRPGVSTPKGIPTTVTTPGSGPGPTAMQMAISAPQPQGVTPTSVPFCGTLEIPGRPEDDGPPDGLTLDRAIDITLERSLDLRAKFFEIPMARADILQANLRSNPVFYQDGQLLQYRGAEYPVQPSSARRPEPG